MPEHDLVAANMGMYDLHDCGLFCGHGEYVQFRKIDWRRSSTFCASVYSWQCFVPRVSQSQITLCLSKSYYALLSHQPTAPSHRIHCQFSYQWNDSFSSRHLFSFPFSFSFSFSFSFLFSFLFFYFRSTCFLYGPLAQAKSMFATTRMITTVIYFTLMGTTLFLGIKFSSQLLVHLVLSCIFMCLLHSPLPILVLCLITFYCLSFFLNTFVLSSTLFCH